MRKILRKWLGIDEDLIDLRIKLEERTRPNLFNIGDDAVYSESVFCGTSYSVSPAIILDYWIDRDTMAWHYKIFVNKKVQYPIQEWQLSKKPQSSINDEIKLSGGPFTIAPQNTGTITIKTTKPKK